MENATKQVVVIGGGFAGLNAAKELAEQPVHVTLIDERNFHLFAPLLYQVATAAISPANIAAPIRSVLRKQRNLTVLMAEVVAIDLDAKRITFANGDTLDYDALILAAGAGHSYFGHDEWEPFAPGLKTLDDALVIRRRILSLYEAAERETDPETRAAMLSFVIVGGGPTGVELAGAIGEIAHHTLAHDFDRVDPRQTKITLLEGQPRLLAMFPERLAKRAAKDLVRLGVTVRTNAIVTKVDAEGVMLGDERIRAGTVIWAAGVQASPIVRALQDVEHDRAGRVKVNRDLSIPGHPDAYIAGDAAATVDEHGKPYPGVAQVAMQQGRWAAKNILRRLSGQPAEPFQYTDFGNMATIGRNRAIADIRGIKLDGFLAWLAWAGLHIVKLIGFRNRLLVMTQWLFAYLKFDRGARLITGRDAELEDLKAASRSPRGSA
jgi:NADH dehydrogenase